ncbi:hypothetical protein OESDEN_17021 [Oesophagostomum dentatum]|uniref:Uncharacterized protein n=1 Tax=Oesophagostomum dentatum TaxID=61180 RepID=A0A0B1SIC0_OESDE|nr:hypothetical protein OESDEN_17021 [Oesophagostomum dentatum]
MFRSIRWKETLDDQVTVLLSSMQLRIDQEEGIRRKKKMREAKLRAQLWLAELRSRSLNKLSRRYRSASAYAVRPRETSVSSAPMPMVSFVPKMASRTRSYNGTLPAIVVQDEVAQEEFSSGSRAISRQSSLYSDFHSECSYEQEVFQFSVDGQNEV